MDYIIKNETLKYKIIGTPVQYDRVVLKIQNNFIVNNSVVRMKKSLIKEIKFSPSGTKTEHVYIKTKLANINNATLSKEVAEKNFNNDDIDLIRVKNRVSVFSDEFPDYRIDITCSYTFNELLSVKNNKSKLLPSNIKSLDDFIKTAYQTNVHYEVEFERINKNNADDIMTEVAKINKFVNNESTDYVREIASILNLHKSVIYSPKFNFKQLGRRPVELNKNMYYNELYPNLDHYYLTEKTDGKRTFLYCDGTQVLAIQMDNTKELGAWNEMFIIDCEQLGDKYFAFDYNMQNNIPFSERYEQLQNAKLPDFVMVKKMLDATEENAKLLFNPAAKIDGLIFTSKDDTNYNTMMIYKWKPIEHITLEFMLKNVGGKYELYCGINRKMAKDLGLTYYPPYGQKNNIQRDEDYGYTKFSSPSSVNSDTFVPDVEFETDLDGKICEMWFNNDKWQLVKIRDEYKEGDYYGNDYRVCQLIFINYQNPLTFKDLFTPYERYFNKSGDDYKAMKKYNLNKKHEIYDKIPIGDKTVIELSCGQGADMWHLASMGYEYGLFCDVDKAAIAELLDRFFNYQRSKQDPHKLKINTLILDLLEPAEVNLEKIRNITDVKFNLVSMQFAIHYFMNDFHNLCKLVAGLTDNYFYFTCFNGFKLMELFVNDEIKFDKYHIIKMNSKKIKVKLPFSDKYYEEYMVFDVESDLKEYGFELIESDSFVTKSTGLEINDEKFSALYYYYIFKRTSKGFEDVIIE